MKAVILAGGLGTRLSEETVLKPKPMVEIGGRPILWHIMKIYSRHGIHDFVICLGYRGYLIKEYFANYNLHMSDVTFDLANNRLEVHHNAAEPWRVTLVETGESTHTAGRLKRIAPYVSTGPFCMTYGDGVSDVDVTKLIAFHRASGKLATVTAVQPTGRFGALQLGSKGLVERFEEKPRGDHGWINGGFFVLEPKALEYCGDDPNTPWERLPMEQLARDQQLVAYQHEGFWHAMDTLRDKNHLEDLWGRGDAPWKVW